MPFFRRNRKADTASVSSFTSISTRRSMKSTDKKSSKNKKNSADGAAISSSKKASVAKKAPAPVAAPVVVDPNGILHLAFSYQSSIILLAANELRLFTLLAKEGPMTHLQIREALKLHPRSTPDLTDSLVTLKVLQRQDTGDDALYSNAPEAALFLDKARDDTYIGHTLDDCSVVMRRWTELTALMKEGSEQGSQGKLDAIIKYHRTAAKARVFRADRYGAVSVDEKQLTPEAIYNIGFSFWKSRVLLAATEFDVFTVLEASPKKKLSAAQMAKALRLRVEATGEFLEVLVLSNMLTRDSGVAYDPKAVYSNTPATALFLDRHKPQYIGGFLGWMSRMFYGVMSGLYTGLKTGERQAPSTEEEGNSVFNALYEDAFLLEDFMDAMAGFGNGTFMGFAKIVQFQPQHSSLVDIGGATGQLACILAQAHPQLTTVTTTDLAPVMPIAEKRIAELWNLQDRVAPLPSDFFVEDFPKADIVTMSLIVLDWNLERKKMLISKAYKALPEGGEFYVIDFMVDNERQSNLLCLSMSLTMMAWHGADGGFTYTPNDLEGWCKEAGFVSFDYKPIPGVPLSMAVARK